MPCWERVKLALRDRTETASYYCGLIIFDSDFLKSYHLSYVSVYLKELLICFRYRNMLLSCRWQRISVCDSKSTTLCCTSWRYSCIMSGWLLHDTWTLRSLHGYLLLLSNLSRLSLLSFLMRVPLVMFWRYLCSLRLRNQISLRFDGLKSNVWISMHSLKSLTLLKQWGLQWIRNYYNIVLWKCIYSWYRFNRLWRHLTRLCLILYLSLIHIWRCRRRG